MRITYDLGFTSGVMHPFLDRLKVQTAQKKSYLCVGLDPDLKLIPNSFPHSIQGVSAFLERVIEATLPFCVCFKPNLSFFEALGIEGLKMLQTLLKRIPSDIPVILDAKRGDIGNTSRMQAEYIFNEFGVDSVTLHPYMGADSLIPFFEYKDKFHFVLALTSNPGASDFEKVNLLNGSKLYEQVMANCTKWHQIYGNVGAVVGATHEEVVSLRHQTPLLFLIPGVGTQGGNYSDSVKNGKNEMGLVLVNIGRGLLYGPSEGTLTSDIQARIMRLIGEDQ